MSGQSHRLASGGLIDRAAPVTFTFDGKPMQGFAGDTLASALVANGVKLIGRSFKYHRPRGLLTANSAEPNALVTLGKGAAAEPNIRATMVPLSQGLAACSQNCWPGPRFDMMAINQLAGSLFSAGFYYKTFMWPAAFWERLYEPLIRRAAGLGRLSGKADPDSYDHDHGFCDLLIIGAGPAGLSAALAAGRAGLRVIVADEDERLGGQLLSERTEIDGAPAHLWAQRVAAELANMPNVRLLSRTAVFGVYDGRTYAAIEQCAPHAGGPRQRLWKIRAHHALLATGAIERPLVFGSNDRPGVMLASAVSTYVNRFAAAPGKRAVVFTTSDSGWATAVDLMTAGIEVAAVVEARRTMPRTSWSLQEAGVPIYLDSTVTHAQGAPLKAVEITDKRGAKTRIKADLLAVGGGWTPQIALAAHLGHRPQWREDISAFVVDQAPPGLTAIGAAAGRYSLSEALADGIRTVHRLVSDQGRRPVPMPIPQASDVPVAAAPLWHAGIGRGKAFVDFQHDVTDTDVELAAREGFVSVEHLKRYTTLGMATDQGRTGQLNGHALLAAATGKSIAEAGTIMARPPSHPVPVGAFAGHHRGAHFRPERRTASHEWSREQGAVFVEAGQWKRAQWFPRPGDADWLDSVTREVRGTRERVGICDVSTLGKIDVQGPDAGALLDRLYVNGFSALPVGKARYGLMLREDGFVLDDGTATRLAEDRYFVTTTTANAARIMQHVDYARQVLWPDLDVQATSVTEQWATYAIAGPQSRALLEVLLPHSDLSNEALPHMGAVELRWRDIPARLFRLSFSGELAYELAVPAQFGDALIRALWDIGRAFGAVAYGTEALGVMRIEKGHPAGNELNGQTTTHDLGFGRMLSTKKDYIGRLMAQRPALTDTQRPRLVGIRPLDPAARLRGGAHLLAKGASGTAANDQGYVTSVAFSPECGHWIGLALLRGGPERHGEEMRAFDPVRHGDVPIAICAPVFIDPKGERLHG